MNKYNYLAIALILSATCGSPRLVSGAELPVGTVISATNIDSIKNDTFENHKIADLLTEKVEMQIKKYGLKIKLRNSEPIDLDPRYVEATKKYSKEIKYDPATNEVTGWKAGIPFPDISMDDPYAAHKLVWNRYYAYPVGDTVNYNKFAFLLISGKTGLERVQHWVLFRYYMKGRLSGDTAVEGDGSIFSNTLLYATYPRDIQGLGTFTIRSDSPKVEDNWAYIKSVRRIRRLSGGSWMDPIGGTDQLNDDLECWNARPSWYSGYKLIGKRWILAVAHATAKRGESTKNSWKDVPESQKGTQAEFPLVDLKNPPYWNADAEWEPREVYVIEAIPPSQHPYGKRVMYQDVAYPRIYSQEIYDRKGEFWKFLNFLSDPIVGEDGYKGTVSIQGQTTDFQRNHATIFTVKSISVNPKGVKAEDVNLGVLEQTALGKGAK